VIVVLLNGSVADVAAKAVTVLVSGLMCQQTRQTENLGGVRPRFATDEVSQ
jgi:hypothetical protein